MIRRDDILLKMNKEDIEKYLSIEKDIAKVYGIHLAKRPKLVLNKRHRTVRKK